MQLAHALADGASMGEAVSLRERREVGEADRIVVADALADAAVRTRLVSSLLPVRRGRAPARLPVAERYALDHHNLDEEFWRRMLGSYSQAEVVELTMCLGSWLAFGRLNHVLGIDAVCVLPGHSAG